MAEAPVSLSRARVRLALSQWRAGLPQALRTKTRLHIADAVGIGLAATAGELPGRLSDGLSRGAGGGSAGVFNGMPRQAPAFAAYLNSALVHILDFDDIHDAARLHPTAVCLPAALAAASLMCASGGGRASSGPHPHPLPEGEGAVGGRSRSERVAGDGPRNSLSLWERAGVRASGATRTSEATTPLGHNLVTAVALGNELMCRLGEIVSPTGTGPGSDWFLTQLFGYFGGALSAGLVLGLDEDGLTSALGLAYMQAAGGKQAGFGTGSNARAVYPAFAAMGGVQAALLAQAGLVGPEGAFDGAAGLFAICLADGAEAMLRDPAWHDSTRWSFEATEIKPWPSCRLSHPYVAAALAVREAMGDATPTSIRVAVNGSAAKLCRPLADRRRPHTLQDAKYSIPYMVAFTLLHGRVELDTLDDRVLADPRLHTLADRVEIDECLPDNPGHPPARIALHVGGRVIDSPDPLPGFDLDAAGIQRKFAACLSAAGAPDRGAALWSALAAIDTQDDLSFVFAPVGDKSKN